MKKIIVFLVATTSLSSIANTAKEENINCFADRVGDKFSLDIKDFEYDANTKTGSIRTINVALVRDGTIADLTPIQYVEVLSNQNLEGLEYNGRKYKEYIKFNLARHSTGNLSVDQIDLLISPKYEVVKTITRPNVWNNDIVWVEEFREFPAVMPLSFNDHHGDYVPLKCISRVHFRQ